jgi:hypothetical protein
MRVLLFHSVLYISSHVFAVIVIPLTLAFPKPYESDLPPINSTHDLLIKLNPSLQRAGREDELVLSSVYGGPVGENITDGVYAAQDSVVRGAIDASAKHQHLLLRPDDVWLTILTQLSFYMRKHKDDQLVRDMWNNLDGQIPPRSSEWAHILKLMDQWIMTQSKERSKENWVLDWVRPSFTSLPGRPMGIASTNGSGEEMMANAVFMAVSTPSFEHIAPFGCLNGIPSITLSGEKLDWIKLMDKLAQMEKGTFGNEPASYARNLRPLLTRFIATFDIPNDPTIRLFWNGRSSRDYPI